jgi:hypothetical protein
VIISGFLICMPGDVPIILHHIKIAPFGDIIGAETGG